MVEGSDGFVRVGGGGQGALDFQACGIASGVVDAVGVVASFASGVEIVVLVGVELGAEADEFLEFDWALGADEFDGGLVAHSGAGGEGV